MSLEYVQSWALSLINAVKSGAAAVVQGADELGRAYGYYDLDEEQPPTAEELEKQKTRDTISEMLVRTGRANAAPNEGGTVGGKADEETKEAAEASARKVLDMMEGGTRQSQADHNARMEQDAPLSHAVSGHGEGTDQVSRLVSGRRNDELIEEGKKFQAEYDTKTERQKAILQQIAKTDEAYETNPPTDDVVDEWAQHRAKLIAENEALKPRVEELRSLLKDTVTLQHPVLGEVEIPKRGTVGDDPNNKSGAFSSNQGMLHVVTEAFAQADLGAAHLDAKAREKEIEESKRRVEKEVQDAIKEGRKPRPESELTKEAAEQRMTDALVKGAPEAKDSYVANIPGRATAVIPDENAAERTGTEEELGYNLEVKGKSTQGEGLSLAHDEAQERYSAVERTGDLQNAKVVLNPAYVDGKRAGFNLQTAYANSDDASKLHATPAELEGTIQGAETVAKDAEGKLERAKYELAEVEKKVAAAQALIDGSSKGIAAYTNQLKGAKFDVQGRDEETLKNLVTEKTKLREACKEKQEKATLTADLKVLEANLKAAENTRLLAEKEAVKLSGEEAVIKLEPDLKQAKISLEEAQKTYDAAEEDAQKLRPPKVQGAKGDGEAPAKSVTAGYDAATGTWKGDRPTKPGGGLSGKDEKGKNLTAHHLYPWNQIREDLNKALQGDAGKLKHLLDFAEVKAPSWLWAELGKEPKDREYRFSEEINRVAAAICWSPKNVMMGPIGDEREDDPKEKLDAAFTKSGLPTVQSAAAAFTDQTGGIGATPTEANERLKEQVTERFLKRLKVKEVKNLTDEQRLAYHRALAEAGEWEGTKADYPRQVAFDRAQTKIAAKFEDLVKQTGKNEDEITDEEYAEIAKAHWKFTEEEEEKLKPEKWAELGITLDDLTAEEKEGLDAQLDKLGMGYDKAKEEFLKSKGKTAGTELTEEELVEMDEALSAKTGPRQRLARKVVSQVSQPEGADERRANEERTYSEEEWTRVGKKKSRTGMVKAPPGLTGPVARFEKALDAEPKAKAAPKKAKAGPAEPTKDDWEEVIKALKAAKTEYEMKLEEYAKQESVATSFEPDAPRLSPEALLQRYPFARKMLDFFAPRLEELEKGKAHAPE